MRNGSFKFFLVLSLFLSIFYCTSADANVEAGGIGQAISRDLPSIAETGSGVNTAEKAESDESEQNLEEPAAVDAEGNKAEGADSISREMPPNSAVSDEQKGAKTAEKEARDAADAEKKRIHRETLIASIESLQDRKKELEDEHKSVQDVYDEVVRQKEFALIRKQATHDARDLASELLRDSESRLAGVQKELPLFRKTVNNLSMQALMKSQDIDTLQREQSKLRKQKLKLLNQFAERGLSQWAESALRRNVRPELSDAILEGSRYVANPFLDSLERASDLEVRLAKEIQSHIPGESSMFYSGLITAFVSLFPAVVVTSIVLRVKRSLSQLSLRHIALLGSIYFAMLSALCLAASTLTRIDVLIHIQKNSQALYDFSVIIHGFVFAFFTATHIATAMADGKSKSFTLSTAIIAIGVHFFSHSTAHLRRGEHPHVDAAAYVVYTAVFVAAAHNIVASAYQRRKKITSGAGANTQRAVRLGGAVVTPLPSESLHRQDDATGAASKSLNADSICTTDTKVIESV